MLLKKLAIFVSGNGSNLQALIDNMKQSGDYEIALIVSDKREAYSLKRAEKENIACYIIDKPITDNSYLNMMDELKKREIDLIVLAGFLKVLPEFFTREFENRIINLHPALLPKHGGVGMYGENVHRAVIDEKDKISGASVHYVNGICDGGELIASEMVNVYNDDTIESLANRIHRLEHSLLVRVVKEVVEKL